MDSTNAEIGELIRQKKQIEQRIRELKNQHCICGKTKIGVEHYPTDKPDRWYLAIECLRHDFYDGQRLAWKTVLNTKSKDEVLDAIPGLIRDLQNLYDMNKNEEAD